MKAAQELGEGVGLSRACDALGVSRATVYRRKAPARAQRRPRKPHPRALSDEERKEVLRVLHSERFVDRAPAEVFATLLDEGTYLRKVRTMYRVLEQSQEVKERRAQRRHPRYKKPELIAQGPGQVWSWDITQLRGPYAGSCFYLYVMLDIFSRFVVGWLVANSQNAELAKRLIQVCSEREGIEADTLTIHSDRGSPMVAGTTVQLMDALGITPSVSRPQVSNDNAFSESQFKTLKYGPDFPGRFGSLEDARSWCRGWFNWYNVEHKHSGLAYFTPEDVHEGEAADKRRKRQVALEKAFEAHPERFSRRPVAKAPPEAVWINPPPEEEEKKRLSAQEVEVSREAA